MKLLKKFWLGFLAAFPLSAGALSPLIIGGAAVGVGIIGVSVWRSMSPVNINEALNFFTSCWTCQIFSDVMVAMSNLLPGIYSALGRIVIPMAVSLLVVLTAWRLTAGFFNAKLEDGFKLMGNFGSYLVKMTVMISLLLMPLPRLITNVLIEPALTIGTSLDYIVSDNNKFAECMVATALADPVVVSNDAANYGAFSPKLRHQLTCEIANIHQITGLGMTVGWTMLNMAFNADYMHKIFFDIPVFPNVPVFFVGLLILVLYFFALLPIPLYFLEVFIKLSLDLVMLPLMLMAWMFDKDNFAIFPQGGKTIRGMIDDVIKAIVGIAITVVFLTFSVMFLNALFENANGVSALQQAIFQNDSKIFMDGLMLRNNSLVLVVLIGLFIAMFMTMIPQLTELLFNIKISDAYYKTFKDNLGILWRDFKQIVSGKGGTKSAASGADSGSGVLSSLFGGDSGSNGGSTSSDMYKKIKYIETTGLQYIDTGLKPDNSTTVSIKLKLNSGVDLFLFGARDGVKSNSFAFKVFNGGNGSSVYVEYGSTDASLDCGNSLAYNTIRASLDETNARVFDESAGSHTDTRLTTQTFSTSNNLFLFCLNDNGMAVGKIDCLFYSCTIKKRGTLVRKFEPALDSNGVPCLYDEIGKKFYYNQGSGRFIAGPAF